jgi:DNA-binding PadR family transcriptional regulator
MIEPFERRGERRAGRDGHGDRHKHRHGGRGAHFGGWGHGRGFRGGSGIGQVGMRLARMLSSLDLQLVILALLEKQPRHGYEIIKTLEEHSNGVYIPSPGMIYPALTYLEETSYARSEVEGNKKLYSITDAGLAYFAENRTIAREILDQLEKLGHEMARMREFYEENEPGSGTFDLDAPGRSLGRSGRWKRELHELRHELKAALGEKSEADEQEKERVKVILRNAILEIRKATKRDTERG